MGNPNNEIINAINNQNNAMHSMRRKTFFENREDALQKLLNNMPLSFFEKQDCVVVGISFAGILFALGSSCRGARLESDNQER